MSPVHKVVWLVVIIIFGCVLLVAHTKRAANFRERESDVKRLVQVCFSVSNLTTTEDLFAAAARQHVSLRSPIPKDPSKPCYRLVTAWTGPVQVFEPGISLIGQVSVLTIDTIKRR